MKRKEEITFRLTKENQQEVYELLKLFNEPIYSLTEKVFKAGELDPHFPYLAFDEVGGEWMRHTGGFTNTVVTFEEFRNILFYEHLEYGDTVTVVYIESNEEWIVVVKDVEETKLLAVEALSPRDLWNGEYEWFWKKDLNIIRYSTNEEIERLDKARKKEEVVAWVPEEGELVEVSDLETHGRWYKKIFCTDLGDKHKSRYVTKHLHSDSITGWKYIRQVEKKVTVTKQEIADWKGVNVNQIEII